MVDLNFEGNPVQLVLTSVLLEVHVSAGVILVDAADEADSGQGVNQDQAPCHHLYHHHHHQ